MRLEWFRQHKQFVYAVLVPMVIVSFVLFGASDFLSKKSGSIFGGGGGPGVTYTVGSKEYYLSPAAVQERRLNMWRMGGNQGQPSSDEVAYNAAALELARTQGYEVGIEEQRERLKQAVEQKILTYDRDTEAKATAENYKKLLAQMEVSGSTFEKFVHEENTVQKYYANLANSIIIADPQQFIDYSAEKENVRLRYLVFKSETFMDTTKAPDEAAIKKFYDDAVKDKEDMKHRDILMAPMTMSVEALGFKDEKKFADPKPTAEDLQKYFDLWKIHHPEWKEPETPPKAGETPPVKPPEPKYKPLASVKDQVEKAWINDEKVKLKNQFTTNMSQMMNDFNADEKKFKDDAANKDKAFDLATWAKNHNMTLWVTPLQQEDAYKNGKMEMNAPNIKNASSLWNYARDYNNRPNQRMTPDRLASFRANMDRFTSFQFFDNEKPELGGAWVRKKEFNDEKAKTLDEAKVEIVKYLKSDEAIDLAKKAADKTKDDWVKGENLPKLDVMLEVRSDEPKKDTHPMVTGFKRAPKVVGDVLDVQSGLPEDAEAGKQKDHRVWFYVGCAVERKLPDWDKFSKATTAEWSREDKRQLNETLDQFSIRAMMVHRIKETVHKIGNEQDKPLGDVLRDARDSQ